LVDGRPLPERPEPVYLALNKPAGFVTTLRDPQARGTVRDFLPHGLAKVFPVGRLDIQSTGLLLLTNDGELTARLTHPRHHVPRTYRVKVRGVPDQRALGRLRRGLQLQDGPTGPVQVVIEKTLPTKSWLCVTVYEGRTRLVRRLCDAIGHRAEKLQRVAIGPLELGKLTLGACRLLTPPEVRVLCRAVGLTPPAHRAGRGRSLLSGGRRRER